MKQRPKAQGQRQKSQIGNRQLKIGNALGGCRLTGKPSVSKIEILGSNPSVPANYSKSSFWKGSLTGKAVVPKTTAHSSLAGSTPVPSANRLEASPNGMAAVC